MNIDKSGTSDLLMDFITNDHGKRKTKTKKIIGRIESKKKQIVNEMAT